MYVLGELTNRMRRLARRAFRVWQVKSTVRLDRGCDYGASGLLNVPPFGPS